MSLVLITIYSIFWCTIPACLVTQLVKYSHNKREISSLIISFPPSNKSNIMCIHILNNKKIKEPKILKVTWFNIGGLQFNRSMWEVLTGRRDGNISRSSEVFANIPSPFSNFTTLKQNFANKNLTVHDLVVLSGKLLITQIKIFPLQMKLIITAILITSLKSGALAIYMFIVVIAKNSHNNVIKAFLIKIHKPVYVN